MYSIYEPEPNLFTLAWSLLLTFVVKLIPIRTVSKIIYGIIYYVFAAYSIIQYGYYLIFGKFLFLSDFSFVGEGAEYSNFIIDIITPRVIALIGIIVLVGVVGIILVPGEKKATKQVIGRNRIISVVGIAISVLIIVFTPKLYVGGDENRAWSALSNPSFEYEKFVNSSYDLELTGIYQYIVHDVVVNIKKSSLHNDMETISVIDTFFEEKPEETKNKLSDVFEGKNVIIVMMEALDDWIITEKDTPTLYMMKENGIYFSQFYTPGYASGYTFNTEFAFNTSIYPYTNGNVAFGLVNNSFPLTIGNLFKAAGYNVNSFHMNKPEFYNRGVMHAIFGYEKYYCYEDYNSDNILIEDDSFLVTCDELYNDLIANQPFMSYVISFSAHVPYSLDDELTQYALKKYPEYYTDDITEEMIIRAKAKLTDEMFERLLVRLDEDGMLENTVIVGFADHYTYGMQDKSRLQELSEEAGSSIFQRTPAFIYCAGSEISMKVEKVMQVTDLAPTIENLFGIEVPKEIMGQDIFNPDYHGFVLFPNNTWLTDVAYMNEGYLVWNNGMTDDQVTEMTLYEQRAYNINNLILDADYYRKDTK